MTAPAGPFSRFDKDGSPVVFVPVEGAERRAKVLWSDWQRLAALDVHLPWLLRYGYVTCRVVLGGRTETTRVARLLLEAPPRKRARHRDGDRLNLRRDNLYLSPMAREAADDLTGALPPLPEKDARALEKGVADWKAKRAGRPSNGSLKGPQEAVTSEGALGPIELHLASSFLRCG